MISTEQLDRASPEALVVGQATIEDAASYAVLAETHDLVLSAGRGWDGDLAAFLNAFAGVSVKRLAIFGPEGLTISPLRQLSDLVDLNLVGDFVGELDLDWFPNLKSFGCGVALKGPRHIKLTWGQCKNLEFTGGSGAKLPSGDVLASFPRLKKLRVDKPTFTPEEIAASASLRELELSSWHTLTAFDQLDGLLPKITSLHLNKANKVVDYAAVSRMRHLHSLILEKCSPFPSVLLLKDLPALERVLLIETKIIDGDLHPFYAMKKLRDVVSATYKHYSPTRDEIYRIINGTK